MSASRQTRPFQRSGTPLAGGRIAPAPASVNPPRGLAARIGKYEVEAEVPGGALVRVFDGWDRATARRVTLKVLTDVADAERVDRFRREVAAIANVRNAGLVSIYELGEHVGMPFAALEHLGGDSLASVISSRRPLSLLEKMRVMWQVAEGIEAAHQSGLVYVGLCPAGIMISSDGPAKVGDFGIVRLTGDLTGENTAYLEALADGMTPDALSDVLAYGIIYYELLTGTHPFSRSGAGFKGAPAPLRELAPECPEPLERLVARAVELDRELRYQSLEDVRFDAEPILRELERARAGALLEEARGWVQSGNPDKALEAVREAIELDPANAGAQRLRSELRSLVQERTVRSRLDSLLHEAEQEAAALHGDRAAELLDSAARLDSGSSEIKSRIEAIRALLAQNRKTRQFLDEARKALQVNDLTRAETKVLEALEANPENAEAAELADAIGEAILRQQVEERVEEGIARAKSLLLSESFDAALAVLAEIESQCPGSPAVAQWRVHIEQQKQQHDRRERLDREVDAARLLMARQQFSEAAEVLQMLQAAFPDEPAISDLLMECAEVSERLSTIAEARGQCEVLCSAEQFESAFHVLDATEAVYPDDPELAGLRREVEQRRQNYLAAASVRQVLAEVQWLLDEDRVDLALQFIRERAAAMPDQPALGARLAAIEQMQPAWEQRRLVEDALRRAAALEQAQQGPVALTILEEALQACPASEELERAAQSLRSQLRENERRKKLTRRVSEVRQAIADGDCEQAEQTLRRALDVLPDEFALLQLRDELEHDKKFREEWRLAQVLVARRQFEEAERILARLDGSKHPEVQTLLKTAREARGAGEEQDFYKRGREKARNLVEQGQQEQAADLLRNLLSLFPGDAILERDLENVELRRRSEMPVMAASEEAVGEPAWLEPDEPETPAFSANLRSPEAIENARLKVVMLPPREEPLPRSAYGRWIMVGGAGLVLVASVGAVTGMFHNSTPSKPPAAAAAAPVNPSAASGSVTPAAAPEQPVLTPSRVATPPQDTKQGKEKKRRDPEEPAAETRRRNPEPPRAPRSFNVASLRSSPALARPAESLPPAPGTGASESWVPELPIGVSAPLQAPAAPPRQAPLSTAPVPMPRPEGGKIQPVRPISLPPPIMPQFAKDRHVSGTVKLDAVVDKTGAVTKIKVLSGDPLLIQAARAGVAKWRYQPATLNGQPIEAEIKIEVLFGSEGR